MDGNPALRANFSRCSFIQTSREPLSPNSSYPSNRLRLRLSSAVFASHARGYRQMLVQGVRRRAVRAPESPDRSIPDHNPQSSPTKCRRGLLDADGLTGEDCTEVDFIAAQTDSTATRDHDGLAVEWIVDIGQPLVGTCGRLTDLGRALHVQGLVRTLVVEDLDELVEPSLLLQKIGSRRLGGLAPAGHPQPPTQCAGRNDHRRRSLERAAYQNGTG